MFGPYLLVELLGRGGMGEVYRAVDTRKDRVVALKLLLAGLADDEDFRRRFRREASAAARLSDPHVVPIHDYGEIEGRLFIDMRFVQGSDLRVTLGSRGPLAPGVAVAIIGQVAGALDAAHAERLIHRDVKPSNILLANAERHLGSAFAYLADFGIVHSYDGASSTAAAVLGSLDYMAPERFGNDPVDHTVDVYALAGVLHQAVTGSRPYAVTGMAALLPRTCIGRFRCRRRCGPGSRAAWTPSWPAGWRRTAPTGTRAPARWPTPPAHASTAPAAPRSSSPRRRSRTPRFRGNRRTPPVARSGRPAPSGGDACRCSSRPASRSRRSGWSRWSPRSWRLPAVRPPSSASTRRPPRTRSSPGTPAGEPAASPSSTPCSPAWWSTTPAPPSR